MKINPIKSNQYITPKTTGYAATATLGAAILSGVSRNKMIRKQHKPLAYISAALTALHIGLIEYYSYKFHSKNK